MRIVKKMLFSLFGIVVAGYLAVCGLLHFSQDQMMFPVPAELGGTLPPDVQQVEISIADGVVLKAVYIPAGHDADQVIFFHGNGSAAQHELQRGLQLRAAGYGVLLAEYRGYSGSSGSPTGGNILEDALGSYDWLRKHSRGKIFAYGHSLGTGPVLYVAGEREIASLVLEAPYNELSEVAAEKFPWLPVKLLFRHNISGTQLVKAVKSDMLLIHGTEDRVIPIRFGRRLFEAVLSTAVWNQIEGAGHNNLLNHGSLQLAIEFFQSHNTGSE